MRHVVSITTTELAEGVLFGRTPEELQRLGPRHQLEVTTVLAEPLAQHVLGCNSKAELDEWRAALSWAVAQVLASILLPLTSLVLPLASLLLPLASLLLPLTSLLLPLTSLLLPLSPTAPYVPPTAP